MRADTKGKDEMGRRFAIVIGVAAAGVIAPGASGASCGRIEHHENETRHGEEHLTHDIARSREGDGRSSQAIRPVEPPEKQSETASGLTANIK